jgi:hypothetical protein
MKTIIKALWCILVLAVSASAANYTVKAGGGGNYSTIQACASAMSPGDTCTVFAGTYNETVTISAGTAGNYKTLTVNTGDTVNVLGFSQGSHTKIDGFHISNTSSPGSSCTSSGGATDFYITNNVMISCGGINGTGTSHGFIQGNTLSYMSNLPGQNNNGPGISLHGDYLLMEHNDISHVSDGLHFGGSHFVFRNNTMHDTLASECGSGSDNGGNCHIDFIEAEPNIPTSYNLYENNTEVNNIGGNAHGFLLQADVCGGNCRTTIVRFNQLAHVNSAGLENDNIWQYVKSYNNDWIDVGSGSGGGMANSCINGATGCGYFNELFYYPGSVSSWNAIATMGSSSSTFEASHNLAYCAGSCASLSGYQYGSGHWLDDPTNLLTNPQFVSYSSSALGNLSLQSTSPAKGAGTNLTTAAGSGTNSTTLVLADANFFQDGSGILGVQPDCIRIGSSTTACIATGGGQINYANNTVTLASPASWNNGDPVYLYKDSNGNVVLNGANPDIGAMVSSGSGSGSPPAPPSGLAAVVN